MTWTAAFSLGFLDTLGGRVLAFASE